MKYIRLYNEEAKYLIDKPELQYPTVSYTEDTTTVHYVTKPKVNTIRMTFSITQDDVDNNNGENMTVWGRARQFDSITVDGVEQASPIITHELDVSYTDDDEFKLTDSSYINTFLRTMSFTFDEPIEQNAKVVFVCHGRYLEGGEWYGDIYSETPEDIMEYYDYTLDMTDDNRIEAITIQFGYEFNDAYQGSVSVHRYADDEDPYDFTLTKDNFIPTVITYTTGGLISLKLPTTEVKDYNVVATKFENVTDMSYMFQYCNSLTSLDLSSFDTSNVTNMEYMFAYCSGLTSIDLSNFDTSNVTSMGWMFEGCSSLTSLDLSSFDTRNVINMNQMFQSCSGLTSLDLSNFDTRNVTSMRMMFYDSHRLTSITFGEDFTTSNVTSMDSMFDGCSGLTSLDLSNFNTSNVTDMNYMFDGCSGLTSLDLSSFDTSKVTKMHGMFKSCSSLTSLDLSNFDTSNVTNMSNMFNSCSGLTSITFGSQADVSKVTNYSGMFNGITTTGALTYPSTYESAWNNIIVTNKSTSRFPSTWTATAVDYENGETVPTNE